MMKYFLLSALISLTSLLLHAQSATSATRQTISLRLGDLFIVEKKSVPATGNPAEINSSLQIQSGGSWIITTKKRSKSPTAAQGYDFVAAPGDIQIKAETICTLSKV